MTAQMAGAMMASRYRPMRMTRQTIATRSRRTRAQTICRRLRPTTVSTAPVGEAAMVRDIFLLDGSKRCQVGNLRQRDNTER